MKNEILPGKTRFKLVQQTGKATRKAVDAVDHLIVVLPPRVASDMWRKLPHGDFLSRLRSASIRRKGSVPMARAGLPGNRGATVSLGSADAAALASPFKRNTLARRLLDDALTADPKSVGVLIAGFAPADQTALAEAFALTALTTAVRLPHRKSKKPVAPRFASAHFFGLGARFDQRPLVAEAEGAGLARWLCRLPPNVLTALAYREAVEDLAKTCGWSVEFHDLDQLRAAGAGAFVAVAQASPAAGPGICHIRYRPDGDDPRAPVALVGKGILFDTGGVNLKPFKGMQRMHEDMQGSAVALGTLLALTRLGFDRPVDCWLAITENHIGAAAYKPHDVVTASNGTTIEVVHTDAEGRMVLADTLAMAAKTDPALIVDYATLTGSCVAALSDRYSGVFTNRADWQQTLVDNGVDSGERVWSFPNDDDFDSDLESKIADVLQCSPSAYGDHILAARFLQRFVPDKTPWLHIDLSSYRREGGLGHAPSGLTGFGVRYTLKLLERDGFGLPAG